MSRHATVLIRRKVSGLVAGIILIVAGVWYTCGYVSHEVAKQAAERHVVVPPRYQSAAQKLPYWEQLGYDPEKDPRLLTAPDDR